MNREHDPSGKVQDRGHLARSIPSLNLLVTSTVWRQDRGAAFWAVAAFVGICRDVSQEVARCRPLTTFLVPFHAAGSKAPDLDKPSSSRWKYTMPAYGCQCSTALPTPR